MNATAAAPRPPQTLKRSLWRAWDRTSVYLPVILMGVMALGTYWLARNTPSFGGAPAQRELKHEPDYFMRGFSVKTFDATGRLKSEIYGSEARHYPDTDTLEIDQPRIRSFSREGVLTTGTGQRALSNGDGTEVQLVGNAVVTREAVPARNGTAAQPPLQIRGDFLHFFADNERVRSHKPVVIVRGNDELQADSLDYDNLDRVLELKGRVRGTLSPGD